MKLLAEINHARAALSTTPPGWLAEHICAAVAVAHRAAAELATLDGWNTALGSTGAALHLNLAETALREAWPSAWWTARPAPAHGPDLEPGEAPDVARAVAALLHHTRTALAAAAVDEATDVDNAPLADRLAAARAICDLDLARDALGDQLAANDTRR